MPTLVYIQRSIKQVKNWRQHGNFTYFLPYSCDANKNWCCGLLGGSPGLVVIPLRRSRGRQFESRPRIKFFTFKLQIKMTENELKKRPGMDGCVIKTFTEVKIIAKWVYNIVPPCHIGRHGNLLLRSCTSPISNPSRFLQAHQKPLKIIIFIKNTFFALNGPRCRGLWTVRPEKITKCL